MAVSAPTALCQFLSAANTLTSGAVVVGTAVPVGTYIEVTAWGSAASTTFTVADSKSNTWRATTQIGNTGGTTLQVIQKFWTIVTNALLSTDTITVTRTVSASLGFFADTRTGVASVGTPITNFATANAAAVTFGSSLTPKAGDSISVGIASTSVSAGTATGGYTKARDAATTVVNTRECATEYQLFPSGGTSSPTYTCGASTQWAATALILSGVSGTLATTLAGATLAATGTETIGGPLATTLAGATLAAPATETISGTLATTLAGATLVSTGTVTTNITGTFATTLAGATLAGVGGETFTGTFATTLAGATLAVTGTERFSGTLAVTLSGATFAATGAETITGTLATTLAGAALAASGAETISGPLATTLAGATFAATGTATNGVTGTLATTLAGATLAATALETIAGTLATSLTGATLAAAGTETFTGTFVATMVGATLTAVGGETFTGTFATTLAGATLAAAGTVTAAGAITTGVSVNASVVDRVTPAQAVPRTQAASVVIRTEGVAVILRTETAEVVSRTQAAEVVDRVVPAEVINRISTGDDVTVPQDYSASKTWTSDWTTELAQPKLVGVTITGTPTTTVPVQPAGGTVTATSPTITDSGKSVSFRVAQTGLTTPTGVVVVVGVTLSNGDTDQRDFPIMFTNT